MVLSKARTFPITVFAPILKVPPEAVMSWLPVPENVMPAPAPARVRPVVPPTVTSELADTVSSMERVEDRVVAPVTAKVEPKVTAPVALSVPVTSSLVEGEVLPIPTLP